MQPAPLAARDAGSDGATAELAPVVPQAIARSVKQLASAKDAMEVFAAGSDLIRVRVEDDRQFIARLANDVWVDEDKLSRGLPRVRKRAGNINGHDGVHVCSGVGAVFGKLSERRLWLAENGGGSTICGSTFGEYTIWRWDGSTWSWDAVHSPKPGALAGGIFATWPIAPAVLGFGVSNQVGDTLQQPVAVMWTHANNAWATTSPLMPKDRYVESTCADSSGVVRAFSSGETKFMLAVASPPALAKPPRTIEIATGYRPDGPCAARVGAEILLTTEYDIVVGFHDKAGTEVVRIGM